MYFIFITEEVSKLVKFKYDKSEQPENILSIYKTWDESKLVKSKDFKVGQSENIWDKLITFKFVNNGNFIDVNNLHSLNIYFIDLTSLISKLLIFSSDKEKQPWNIDSILVTFEVTKFERSIEDINEQLLNI